jgi:glycosyltransferase involved in cell wall biosynthesis
VRLAIDASRTTVTRVTGTENYAIQLIRALIRRLDATDSPHEVTLYFRDRPAPDLFPSSPRVTQQVIPLRRAWTHLRFAAALWRDRPDRVFVPAHTLPFAFPGQAAVTVHDLGFKYFPQSHKTSHRLYLDLTTRYSAARAGVILADSQATADDLTRFYGTDPEKVRVVYPGVDVPPISDIDRVRNKYQLPPRYFLYIGTLQPRKNIAGLTAAYRRYRESTGDDAALLLAGAKGWLYDPAWTDGVEGVLMPGYIDEADKGALYAGAIALVFPSLYEGFGFPVLEAMGCGTPVIASNTSSLPELVGNAGLLVDPTDTEAITQAMQHIVTDQALAESLREKGRRQAAAFSWEHCAQQALDALME